MTRKIAYALLTATTAWLALEVVAFVALSVSERVPATPAFFDRQRAVLGGTVGTELEAVLETVGGSPGRQVLHPYLGFVVDPEGERVKNITPLGFHRSLRALAAGEVDDHCGGGDRTQVAVFGGSVALIFSQLAGHVLLEALAADGTWSAPCLRTFALAGYKQPQQLHALAWLLALGEDIDVVINLDGFNELVLPVAENLPLGVNYAYPRRWSLLSERGRDARSDELRGEVAYLRGLRRRRAAGFSRRPWAYSALSNLAWRAQDRRLAARTAAIETEHAAAQAERTLGYERRGPRRAFDHEEALYAELAALWERSSLTMRGLCAARGIDYYHVLQPNQYVEGSKPLSPREQSAAINPRSPYKPAVKRGYPHLREAGERLAAAGVRFYDLHGVFAAVEETLYVDDCCHFNARGAELLAAALADRIREDRAR